MTLQDKIENMQTEHNFRSKIGMMLFLSNVSHSESYFDNNSFKAYKELLKKVTGKIEKWHDKRNQDGLNGEKFLKDEDYVELDESPSKFDTCSENSDDDAAPSEEEIKVQDEKLS